MSRFQQRLQRLLRDPETQAGYDEASRELIVSQDNELAERLAGAQIGVPVWLGYGNLWYVKEEEDGPDPFTCEHCGHTFQEGQIALLFGDHADYDDPDFLGCAHCAARYTREYHEEITEISRSAVPMPPEVLVDYAKRLFVQRASGNVLLPNPLPNRLHLQ